VTDTYDFLAITEEEIFKEARERLALVEEAESENRANGILALNFVDGDQWDQTIANQRTIDQRPALTINHTEVMVDRQCNTLRQQRPRIKVHPVGDGADVESARVVNGVIRNIETLSNASVAYDAGVASAAKIGWGYWRIVSDYVGPDSFDQELKILPIRNTFTVYMDPGAVMPAGEDQNWCIISEKMKRAEFKRRYPRATNAEWQGDAPGDMNLGWESKDELRLAEYFRKFEKKDTLFLMTDGSTKLKSQIKGMSDNQLDAAIAIGLGVQTDEAGKPISRPTYTCEVQWFRLNGTKVVDRKVIPGRFIPVIRCEGNVLDVNGQVKRKGMVKNLMDPQRMYNYWRTAETERYALAPKAPWVAYENVVEGHPEWNDANRKPYSTLIAKAVTGPNGELLPLPQRSPPAPVEQGMAQAAMGAEHDLMSVAGMPQENPEIQARVMSGNKYLQRRQGMQDLTHFQYYDNQTLAIMWTGLVLLEQIPAYYDTKRIQRIIGDDGVPSVVTINDKKMINGVEQVVNNMTLGRYDVVMDTGPGYQTKREENSAYMLELLGTALGQKITETSADIVLRNMDFDGAGEMADRIAVTIPGAMDKIMEGLPEQAKTIIGSLQQQLQQLKQVAEQQALEIKYRNQPKMAELDQRETNDKREDATKRYDIDTDAVTRRDVAEISAAAQLLNTKAESAHEEGMADKMIKNGVESAKKD
jgi:hypothetical protein